MPDSAAERQRRALRLACVALAFAGSASAAGVGDGDRARSALGRVGVPEPGRPGSIAVAGDLNGGVTEALRGSDSVHGRTGADLAVAVDAARFLDFGARINGRYDRHASDERGSDDGFLFQSELSARLAWRFGNVGLGLEGTAWLPGGSDLGQSLSALGADGKLLLSGHASNLVVAGFAGYRLDRSSEASGDVARMRFGDYTALGASDYDALLAGLGAGYLAGGTTLFGEAAAQLLLGSPKFSASPIWVTLGARAQVGPPGLSVELSASGLLSARPELGPNAPLMPIEPRVTLALGLRYRFGEAPKTEAVQTHPTPPKPEPTSVPAPPPPPASVDLALLDERGEPLARAKVVLTQGPNQTPLVETEPGHYRLDDPKSGPARLQIEAEGFQPIEREIQVGTGSQLHLDVRAEVALPAGQLRGLVRSFRGKPLAATVHVEPGGTGAKTDTEGFFQIDVPPGEYQVVIEAPGFEPQRRKAKVDQQGVVIVNADLVQKR